MKNILMLNYEFPPLGGGAANASWNILNKFLKITDLKIVLVTASANHYRKEIFSDNIEIYYLDIGKTGSLHFQSVVDLLRYALKTYLFCRKMMKKRKFDLVHAFFGIPCGYIALKLRLPYLVSLRGSDVPFYNRRFFIFDRSFFCKLSRKIWAKAKRVIANSADLRALALKSSPEQRIEVIGNGVNLENFHPANKASTEFTIISTSRLIKRKGLEYLLEAFFAFNSKYSKSRLIFAGGGELLDTFKAKVKKQGAEKKVAFCGVVDKISMPNLYRQADVFVLPSLNEGMSNSLLEALASGLAMITTDTGGAKESVDETNGFIVKKENWQDIYECLEKLYLNNNLLKAMKIASRNKAQKLSWDNVANDYLKIYDEICAESTV